MKLILSDLTSRDAYYSKRGYRDSYYGFVVTDSQKFSEVYDLDAEYERYRDAFGYPSLDNMIGVNSAMASGYTEFRQVTPDEFLNLQSLPDEPNKKLAIDVGFAVIMAHTDEKGNLFIDRISARGNGMIFAEPIQQTDAVAVKLFEAGEYVVGGISTNGKVAVIAGLVIVTVIAFRHLTVCRAPRIIFSAAILDRHLSCQKMKAILTTR